jgi:hypothetical protein
MKFSYSVIQLLSYYFRLKSKMKSPIAELAGSTLKNYEIIKEKVKG